MSLHIICPECKNGVDTSSNSDLKQTDIIECDTCGMTLEVISIHADSVEVDIVDEGK